jgi:dTDP-4-amino-4,6-dideoxygalactose transaminase/RimJ/RimL family protein N-acetyltransferase
MLYASIPERKYCVAFNSGTSALHAAYLAVGYDDPVIYMNPITFVATANMAQSAEFVVRFSDDRPEYSRWVSMHYAGRYHGPGIIEDACHALGSDSPYGKVGNCGGGTKITVFSTHAIKNITTGEGGLATTNDGALASHMQDIRSHGRVNGEMVTMGYNYRMTDIQAALGLSQLSKIDKFRDDKQELAHRYDRLVTGQVISYNFHNQTSGTHWHLYVIEAHNRDKLATHLATKGIETRVHYPPVHLQPYWGGREGTCPKAEAFAKRCLSSAVVGWHEAQDAGLHHRVSKGVLRMIYLDALSQSDCEQIRRWRNRDISGARTPYKLTELQQERFYEDVVSNRDSRCRYWAVKDIMHELAGIAGLTDIEWENGRAEISLMIGPDYRRCGFGHHALTKLMEVGFEQMRLNVLYGNVYACNADIGFWFHMFDKYEMFNVKIPCGKWWGNQWHATHYFQTHRHEWGNK